MADTKTYDCMKNLFFVLLVLTSLNTHAQNISGLYSGTLYNDTTKQTQTYELALSEYRGKITGYAYATFIVNDTFYYSIRRVKATKKESELLVEDEDMLANNFPVRPDKGVRRITQIPLDHLKEGDTLTTFRGTWKTTRTKAFYSLPGTMAMKRDSDSARSSLIAHLTELNIIKQATTDTQADVVINTTKEKKKAPTDNKEKVKPETTDKMTVAAAVIPYLQRQQKTLQTMEVKSDSLVLSFYDNGVVDGDIISVYLNGESVISNSKLLAVATKKTILLNTHTSDEIKLVLVAENLGSMPPNTGLLVVQDGGDKYEVRFSADLQTNAAILFKKRK